jgi:hypothetical protein
VKHRIDHGANIDAGRRHGSGNRGEDLAAQQEGKRRADDEASDAGVVVGMQPPERYLALQVALEECQGAGLEIANSFGHVWRARGLGEVESHHAYAVWILAQGQQPLKQAR